MLSPLPRRSGWAYCFAQSPSRISLPRKGCRVGLRIVLFEVCSAFTRVTACTRALSPIRDTLTRGFSHFCYLHDCSGCFRLERLPGGTYTHWKAPPFHGAHPKRTSVRRLTSNFRSPGNQQNWLIAPNRAFLPPQAMTCDSHCRP